MAARPIHAINPRSSLVQMSSPAPIGLRYSMRQLSYVVALLASSLAAMGGYGLIAAIVPLVFWAYVFHIAESPRTGFIYGSLGLGGLLLLACLGLPAINVATQSAYRNTCMSNLKEIGFALLQYRSAHGRFPPACIRDESGRPQHSWRVLILPYLEESRLYAQYRFDEPWDGPNNRKLAARTPSPFVCPTNPVPGRTTYVAVTGAKTIWETPLASEEEFRKQSRTILVLEGSQAVPWMEPSDLAFDDAVRLLAGKSDEAASHGHDMLEDQWHKTIVHNATMADDSVCRLPLGLDEGQIEQWLAAGDANDKDDPRLLLARLEASHTAWLTARGVLFLLVCALPLPWALFWSETPESNDPTSEEAPQARTGTEPTHTPPRA
jgi:hypothetical protein